ncbi:prion-inhibition and propagation-domain-containing protein [Neurospora hispaniola]|uniref:Prion-inhibition and propagation-domain-containing protein n=1 Tax=Neurospora hispaniola TaxID=588809 RepID=A0AAJ0MRZ6_9PEZI|nr:prion-inhibition and propagation-domain-containing protein [Neurospora hispaniola]
MDPLSAFELAQVVLDNTVRLFKFVSALVEYPEECEKYRLQLIIEYNRVLAWAKAAGLIEITPSSSLASTLGTNATELITILARIQWLLAEFRDLNARYGNELVPSDISPAKDKEKEKDGKESKDVKGSGKDVKGNSTDSRGKDPKAVGGASSSKEKSTSSEPKPATDEALLSQISSLALSYDQSQKEQKLKVEKEKEAEHRRGTNHIRRFFRTSKDVVTHPSRVRWVMVDKEAFEALLLDLHSLTERLDELMRGYQQSKMDDIIGKTYREMILARDGIGELKDMVDVLGKMVEGMEVAADGEGGREGRKKKMVNDVQDLIRLKKMARVSEELLSRLHQGQDPTAASRLEASDTKITIAQFGDPRKGQKDFLEVFIICDGDRDSDGELHFGNLARVKRPQGYLTVREGMAEVPVWIEWKPMGDYAEGSIEEKAADLRTLTLAEMLHLPKPDSLHVPKCIGYLDARDACGADMYGFIFKAEKERLFWGHRIVSLYDLLGTEMEMFKPSLSQRFDLALKLCTTVLNLHTVNWLHKGIFSGNVLFYFDCDNGPEMKQAYDPEKPYLCGFGYSRPEKSKTTARSLNMAWDLYRWPAIQREHPTDHNSRKTYDLYSLGLVLLEIGHWKPLDEILCLKESEPSPSFDQTVTVMPLFVQTVVPERKPPSVSLSDSKKARDWLLGTLGDAPFIKAKKVNPLGELRNLMGDKYTRAVERCLWAHGEKGFGVEDLPDQSTDSGVGIRLQEAFTKYVIEELQGVNV